MSNVKLCRFVNVCAVTGQVIKPSPAISAGRGNRLLMEVIMMQNNQFRLKDHPSLPVMDYAREQEGEFTNTAGTTFYTTFQYNRTPSKIKFFRSRDDFNGNNRTNYDKSGSRTRKEEPLPSSLSTSIFPRWAST